MNITGFGEHDEVEDGYQSIAMIGHKSELAVFMAIMEAANMDYEIQQEYQLLDYNNGDDVYSVSLLVTLPKTNTLRIVK